MPLRSLEPLRRKDSVRTFSLFSRASRCSSSVGVYLLAAPPKNKQTKTSVSLCLDKWMISSQSANVGDLNRLASVSG